ncbi:MAG TPA: tripartite tricarboxylate transporter substrate binding protein [Clostridia bacterium]|nr:tripartite tricarboxylate transporter substrate binding protein [Clostridia bacterium]
MKRKSVTMVALALAIAMTMSACGGSASSAPASTGTAPAASSAASSTANTNAYPGKKNIVLYCGYSAGGSSDTLARLTAAKVGQILGTTCTVENVTGASGWVMWNQMMENTPADGYSFFLINSPNVTAGKYDKDNTMKYDHNDFELICNQVTDSNCMAIRKDDSRYSDWESFSAFWKKQGSMITSASGLGITSDDATADRLMAKDLGVEVDIIASGGSGDNITLLLNGTTDYVMGNVSEMVAANNEGQYKILCVFSDARDPNLPDVPTYEELTGHQIIGCSSRGYAMLKNVPDDIKAALGTAVKQAVQDPDMVLQLMNIYTTTDFKDGQTYADYLTKIQNTAREVYGV